MNDKFIASSGRTHGKTNKMLMDAIEKARQGERVSVIGAHTRHAIHMAETAAEILGGKVEKVNGHPSVAIGKGWIRFQSMHNHKDLLGAHRTNFWDHYARAQYIDQAHGYFICPWDTRTPE